MCGFCGEVRFDGTPVDLGALGAMNASMVPRGPDGHGVWSTGGRGPGASAPEHHRPQHPCRPAHGRQRARPHRGLQRLHIQLPGIASGVGGQGLSILFPRRYRGGPQGLSRVGGGLRPAIFRHVRLRGGRARQRAGHLGARSARHQALVLRGGPGRAALRFHAPCTACRRRSGHGHRSGRASPLHALPCRGARALYHFTRRAQAPSRDHPGH